MCVLCGTQQPTATATEGATGWFGGRISSTVLFTEATDVGETTGTAQAIAIGEEAFGNIADSADEDMYSVQVVAGQTYHINLGIDPSGGTGLGDSTLTIYNSAGAQIGFNDDSIVSTNSYLSYTADYSGTLYLLADAFSIGTGDYMLSVYQDDIVETTGTPAVLLVNSSVTGLSSLDGNWDDDWYAVTLAAGTNYILGSVAANSLDYTTTFVEVHDSTGLIVASGSTEISFTVGASGTYYVTSSPDQNTGFGTYELYLVESGGGGGGSWEPANLAEPLASIDWGYTAPTTINVYFATGGGTVTDGYSDSATFTTSGWDATERAAAEAAFQQVANVANVTFNYVVDPLLADFMMFDSANATTALGYWGVGGGIVDIGGIDYDLNGWGVFNTLGSGWDAGGLAVGGYAFITLIHEIGHGMGLAHPHDNGGTSSIMTGVTSPFGSLGTFELNQGIWTTMSYNDGWITAPHGASPSNNYGWQASMMTLDIAVLQDTYGANTTYNSGANVYTLPSSNGAGSYYQAIWDNGGTDTIVNSGSGASIINLNAAPLTNTNDGGGYVSYVSGIHGGFTIANGVVIENATGGSGVDTITGNAVANTLTGNGGADVLAGGEGDDILDGGADADAMDGGGGNDRVIYTTQIANLVINLATGIASGGDAAGDTLTSIEHASGGSGNDTITGSSGSNILDGNAGNDTLVGGAGIDTLNGGEGNDAFNGGAGADRFEGGNGTDRVSYYGVTTNLTIYMDGRASVGGDAAGDVLVSIEQLNGGNANDTIYGDNAANLIDGGIGNDVINGAGGNDTLRGGEGNDVFSGGAGADRFEGGNGTDRVSYYGVTTNLTIYMDGRASVGGDAAGDVLVSIEQLNGGNANDTIFGDNAANLIDGGVGNDVINGAGGNDTLRGGEGNDAFNGGAGADRFEGGNGTDRVSYYGVTTNLTIYMDGRAGVGGDAAGDVLVSIEQLNGGNANDTIFGDNAANLIDGGIGNDVISGGGGNDTLRGANGNDTLSGDLGNDSLTGGLNDDVFVFQDGWGIDTIVDFNTSNLEDLDLSALTNITDFADLLASHARDTVISGVTTLEIFDGANIIRLKGYTLADLGVAGVISADDFVF